MIDVRKQEILSEVSRALDKCSSPIEVQDIIDEIEQAISFKHTRALKAKAEHDAAMIAFRAMVEEEVAICTPLIERYCQPMGWDDSNSRNFYQIGVPSVTGFSRMIIQPLCDYTYNRDECYPGTKFVGLKYMWSAVESIRGTDGKTLLQILKQIILQNVK